ncbi:CAP domain-containing protein [Actinoplanes flavus]|uniref:CAP domain-containing protein n=1 Tax=Actinoplanes flavus TaxID=2820290 RepID=A0ABS3UKM9_9ACTN|nr:CAP domain-containing protein [Actinoplanes flavus]MBO3739348.1 CAP domain-containing protein [Actinoplanes flavus]
MEHARQRADAGMSLTRRGLVIAGLGATAALAGLAGGTTEKALGFSALQQQPQPDWRFCGKCNGMFFSGRDGSYYRENQRCPASGLHEPMGFNFVLPHDVPGSATAQPDWRFCGKCNGMFFSGRDGSYYRENQRCPASGLHEPMGFNFVLPHDVPGSATAQPDWRFCGKCNGMFFSGRDGSYYRENQRCPASGLHEPMGYNFVLPHQGIVPDGSAPLSPAEQQVLDEVNAIHRESCGTALTVDPRLVGVARRHADDLSRHPGPPGLWEKGDANRQGHVGSDGSDAATRISREVGRAGTENAYVRYYTGSAPAPEVRHALDYWRNSPGHNATMRNCAYRTTGVGVAVGKGFVPVGQPNAGSPATLHYFIQTFAS